MKLYFKIFPFFNVYFCKFYFFCSALSHVLCFALYAMIINHDLWFVRQFQKKQVCFRWWQVPTNITVDVVEQTLKIMMGRKYFTRVTRNDHRCRCVIRKLKESSSNQQGTGSIWIAIPFPYLTSCFKKWKCAWLRRIRRAFSFICWVAR